LHDGGVARGKDAQARGSGRGGQSDGRSTVRQNIKTGAVLHLLISFVLLSCCFLSLFLTKIFPPRLLVLRCVDQGGGHAARQDAERQQQAVRKPPLFAPFTYKIHLFTKTGSGQTQGKLKKEWRFWQGC
jgi:hypothetical protein